MNLTSVSCCGMREIDGLSHHRDPAEALKAFVAESIRSGAVMRDDQIYGYHNYSATVPTLLKEMGRFEPRFRYAVFTQAGARSKYGIAFAKYISENNLGKVVRADSKFWKNPNSGNMLTAWIWTLDEKAIDAHVKQLIGKKAEADPTEELNA